MKRFVVLLFIILSGCRGAKYSVYSSNFYFDSYPGKWVLNEIEDDYKSRLYKGAYEHFSKHLKDSLIVLGDVRHKGDGIMDFKIPFEPTANQLKAIKQSTNCDYLINIKATTLKDEKEHISLAVDEKSTIEENAAKVELNIYDLNSLELVSGAYVIGVDKREISRSDIVGLMTTPESIKINGLWKLLKKYR